jgi:hypothetical protein
MCIEHPLFELANGAPPQRIPLEISRHERIVGGPHASIIQQLKCHLHQFSLVL